MGCGYARLIFPRFGGDIWALWAGICCSGECGRNIYYSDAVDMEIYMYTSCAVYRVPIWNVRPDLFSVSVVGERLNPDLVRPIWNWELIVDRSLLRACIGYVLYPARWLARIDKVLYQDQYPLTRFLTTLYIFDRWRCIYASRARLVDPEHVNTQVSDLYSLFLQYSIGLPSVWSVKILAKSVSFSSRTYISWKVSHI